MPFSWRKKKMMGRRAQWYVRGFTSELRGCVGLLGPWLVGAQRTR